MSISNNIRFRPSPRLFYVVNVRPTPARGGGRREACCHKILHLYGSAPRLRSTLQQPGLVIEHRRYHVHCAVHLDARRHLQAAAHRLHVRLRSVAQPQAAHARHTRLATPSSLAESDHSRGPAMYQDDTCSPQRQATHNESHVQRVDVSAVTPRPRPRRHARSATGRWMIPR